MSPKLKNSIVTLITYKLTNHMQTGDGAIARFPFYSWFKIYINLVLLRFKIYKFIMYSNVWFDIVRPVKIKVCVSSWSFPFTGYLMLQSDTRWCFSNNCSNCWGQVAFATRWQHHTEQQFAKGCWFFVHSNSNWSLNIRIKQ